MQRRQFVKGSLGLTLIPAFAAIGCGGAKGTAVLLDQGELVDMEIFGYFQGYGENETLANRDPRRTDGTRSGILTAAQALAAETTPLTLTFWHGHGGRDHKFEITPDHMAQLKRGETIYVMTSVVDGHKHCARIIPQFAPGSGPITDNDPLPIREPEPPQSEDPNEAVVKVVALEQTFQAGITGQRITSRQGTTLAPLSRGQVQALEPISLSFPHDHDGEAHHVTIQARHLERVAAGEVTYVSTTAVNGHFHVVMLTRDLGQG